VIAADEGWRKCKHSQLISEREREILHRGVSCSHCCHYASTTPPRHVSMTAHACVRACVRACMHVVVVVTVSSSGGGGVG
jgi:hypothetical protein